MATLNPAQAQARLRQSRVAAARQRAQTSPNRGPVFESEGGKALASGYKNNPVRSQSTQIGDDDLLNRPRSAADDTLRAQERAAKERENSRKWTEHRIDTRNMLQQYVSPPQEFFDMQESGQATPELEASFRQMEMAQTQARAQEGVGGAAAQLRRARDIAQKAQAVQEQINRINKMVERAKDAKDLVWTLYAAGSTAEAEGAAVESVHGSGIIVSLYRVIKTIIMPSAAFSKDPNAGQFFKGPLGFIEPTVLKPTKITAWIAGLHGIYGIIVTGFIFVMIFLSIAIVGFIFIVTYTLGNSIGGMIAG